MVTLDWKAMDRTLFDPTGRAMARQQHTYIGMGYTLHCTTDIIPAT